LTCGAYRGAVANWTRSPCRCTTQPRSCACSSSVNAASTRWRSTPAPRANSSAVAGPGATSSNASTRAANSVSANSAGSTALGSEACITAARFAEKVSAWCRRQGLEDISIVGGFDGAVLAGEAPGRGSSPQGDLPEGIGLLRVDHAPADQD